MKGFEVFKKYLHLFSSRNIVVRLFGNPEEPIIVMVNKENLLNVLNKYKSDFEQVLGLEITSDNFLA
jgi:hypothetical protein